MKLKKWGETYTFDHSAEFANNELVRGKSPQQATKEMLALKQFKMRIKDCIKPTHGDHYLIKWLKARNFDVDKAEQMFRTVFRVASKADQDVYYVYYISESMAYREQVGCDRLLEEYTPPQVLQKYLAGGFCGYDKDGSPILIELYGYMDMKGLLHSVKKSDIEKTKLLLGERVMQDLEKQSNKLGRRIDGMTVIIDMEHVGTWMLWGPGIQMYAHMGHILQDNYPEIVKRSFIVNAPPIFPILWKMIKPLITEEMKKKVCILGADYQKELLNHIDEDQLPAFLGGTQTDENGDPRCPSKICQGGTVPEEYYLKDLSNTSNMETVTVGRGDKEEIEFHVNKPGSMLRWEFKTDGFDVGFGVVLKKINGDVVHLVKTDRVNSHMVPEDGAVNCKEIGTYVVCFDNTYSWTRSKVVYYNIDVVSGDDSIVADLDTVTQGGKWSTLSQTSESLHF